LADIVHEKSYAKGIASHQMV